MNITYLALLISLLLKFENNHIKLFSTDINGKTLIQTDTIQKINITDSICEKYNIPNVNFSIDVPTRYKVDFNHKQGSALRVNLSNVTTSIYEIAIGTMVTNEDFVEIQEEKWFQEFKNFPQIKNNPNLTISPLEKIEINGTKHSCYLMKYKNGLTSLMTLGVIYSCKKRCIVVALSKEIINEEQPLNKNEELILSSIKIINCN